MTEQTLQQIQNNKNNASNDESIGLNDVLLGRGGATNGHVGNRKFRTIVSDHQAAYLSARKPEKVLIARQIVSVVRNNGGRFLRRCEDSESWIEVTPKRAQEKTSQALREGLDVRNFQTGQKPEGDSVDSSKSSEKRSSSTRKPYTIRQNVVTGKVVSVASQSPPRPVTNNTTATKFLNSSGTDNVRSMDVSRQIQQALLHYQQLNREEIQKAYGF